MSTILVHRGRAVGEHSAVYFIHAIHNGDKVRFSVCVVQGDHNLASIVVYVFVANEDGRRSAPYAVMVSARRSACEWLRRACYLGHVVSWSI